MNIPIKDKNTMSENVAKNRAIQDMIIVYQKEKMYINEKSYTMRLIENLYNLGYYNNNESIY